LRKIHPQECMQRWIGTAAQVFASQVRHLRVILFLASGMDLIPAVVAAQGTVKFLSNMKQFVENPYEFLVQIPIEKPRQTKRHQIENFATLHTEALHLVLFAPLPAGRMTMPETHRRDPSLQAMGPARSRRSYRKQDARRIDLLQVLTPGHNVR